MLIHSLWTTQKVNICQILLNSSRPLAVQSAQDLQHGYRKNAAKK